MTMVMQILSQCGAEEIYLPGSRSRLREHRRNSYPFGNCNIQSKTKVVFCLMHNKAEGLKGMGVGDREAYQEHCRERGVGSHISHHIRLLPENFWQNASGCVRRADGDKRIRSIVGT